MQLTLNMSLRIYFSFDEQSTMSGYFNTDEALNNLHRFSSLERIIN